MTSSAGLVISNLQCREIQKRNRRFSLFLLGINVTFCTEGSVPCKDSSWETGTLLTSERTSTLTSYNSLDQEEAAVIGQPLCCIHTCLVSESSDIHFIVKHNQQIGYLSLKVEYCFELVKHPWWWLINKQRILTLVQKFISLIYNNFLHLFKIILFHQSFLKPTSKPSRSHFG